MVARSQQRRVRGALDRFGPPLASSVGGVLIGPKEEPSASPQETSEVEESYFGRWPH
jgi:hypothetical protein